MSKTAPKQGDQTKTTAAIGEESPAGGDGDEGMTTLMIGEEQLPEEEAPAKPAPPTKKSGEEAVTTLALGEESPGKGGGRGGGPFGRF